jgi:hypothetical protein
MAYKYIYISVSGPYGLMNGAFNMNICFFPEVGNYPSFVADILSKNE